MTYMTSVERVQLKRAKDEGREEGAAKLLTELITFKFGEFPDWAKSRMAEADEATLTQWSLRILNAERIEDVFV